MHHGCCVSIMGASRRQRRIGFLILLTLLYVVWIGATHHKATAHLPLAENASNVMMINKTEWTLREVVTDNASRGIRGKHGVPRVSNPKTKQKKKSHGIIEGYENPSVLHAELQAFYNISSDGTNLWDDASCQLPSWMKHYLNWHKHTREQIIFSKKKKKNGFSSPQRFLIMTCLQTDSKCGGTADRLKPLPFVLRIAYYTKRLLLIRWTKPAALEEFLLPPQGGIDWRLQPWMAKEVREFLIFYYFGIHATKRKKMKPTRSFFLLLLA